MYKVPTPQFTVYACFFFFFFGEDNVNFQRSFLFSLFHRFPNSAFQHCCNNKPTNYFQKNSKNSICRATLTVHREPDSSWNLKRWYVHKTFTIFPYYLLSIFLAFLVIQYSLLGLFFSLGIRNFCFCNLIIGISLVQVFIYLFIFLMEGFFPFPSIFLAVKNVLRVHFVNSLNFRLLFRR